jgi:hypothetical protein
LILQNLTQTLSKPLLNLPLTGTTYETFSLQERETTKWRERLMMKRKRNCNLKKMKYQ